MILAIVFCSFALIALIRLAAFARFTAHEKNAAGAAMLWTFTIVIFACTVLAVIRL